uniref:GB1/RHD3-type G domain-containing protein n=1 Tax=Glossina pallidipes TaxID=7398 RepID=A0A1A9ZZN1_GLOPL
MSGKALQIITTLEDHSFVLNEEELSEVLMRDDVKDRYICVVSVAGSFRKGKSFLLDFFLRYMYANQVVNHETGDWLGNDNQPLTGFSWRGGSERDTTGILMWSDIFCVDTPNGDKVAVILLDTQGTFDSQSTVRECATVFALSTMVSSVQIYNLSQNIQEDDLQHLQLFTEYGRLALADTGTKPFQRLQFLVRDWSFPYEADYGASGGELILKRRLEISDRQHPELQSLRRHISSCFDDVSCFLMPHPGLDVATNPKFDGRLKDIRTEFKQNLRSLVPMLLSPENLVIKKINGQKVRAKDLIQYFQSYVAIYKGNELPEPKSMLVATAEANHLTAIAAAKELYNQLMQDVCGGTRPYLSSAHLESEHLRVKDKAIFQFLAKRKMGGEEFTERFRQQLDEDIETMFESYRAHNESKNIFKAARTPAVFFAVAVIFYILSGIFGLFGLYTFANFSSLIMGMSLLLLVLWSYVRYSGELTAFGNKIDHLANFLWDNFMKPVYQGCISKGIQHVATQATEHAVGGSSSRCSTAELNGQLKQQRKQQHQQETIATKNSISNKSEQRQKDIAPPSTPTNNNYIEKPQKLKQTSVNNNATNAANATAFGNIWSKFSASCSDAKQQKLLQKQQQQQQKQNMISKTLQAANPSGGGDSTLPSNVTNRKKRKSKKNNNNFLN